MEHLCNIVNDFGTPKSEGARCVGVTGPAVSKMMNPVATKVIKAKDVP